MPQNLIFDYGLKAFLFLSPLFYFRSYQVSFARGMFFVIATFALFGISLLSEQRRNFSDKWLFGIFILALVNTFFYSGIEGKSEWYNFWISCSGFIYVFCGILLFRTVYCYAGEIKQYIVPIVLVCVINLGICISQVLGYSLMWKNMPSVCGMFEISSQLGQYSALSIPLLYIIHPLLCLIPVSTLLISKSIAPMVSFIVGLMFFSMYKRKLFIAFFISAIVCCNIFSVSYVVSKWKCRPVMWEKTINSALQKPFLGWGYRSFSDKVVGIKDKGNIGGVEYSRAHNDYLHTAQELGSPILICFILFISNIAIKYYRLSKWDTVNLLFSSVLIGLVNMSGQTLIRYASVGATFIIILSLLCIEMLNEDRYDKTSNM